MYIALLPRVDHPIFLPLFLFLLHFYNPYFFLSLPFFNTSLILHKHTQSYSYVATAVPMAQQKLILTLVSTSRTIGMAIGPFVNMALVKVSFDLHIGTWMTIPVNPNNAAGLVMATGEVFLLGVMLVFLKEPTPLPPADNNQMKHHRTSSTSSSNQWMEIAKAMCCIDLFLPPFIMTVVWVNFQTYVIIIRRMSLFMLV